MVYNKSLPLALILFLAFVYQWRHHCLGLDNSSLGKSFHSNLSTLQNVPQVTEQIKLPPDMLKHGENTLMPPGWELCRQQTSSKDLFIFVF